MASAFQFLGAAFSHTSPKQNDQEEKSRSGKVFLKASVNVNVLHLSPKVYTSDEA